MPTPLNLHISLPEEYTPLQVFDTRVAAIDERLAQLEAGGTGSDGTRIAELEAHLETLTAELAALKQQSASASEVDTLRTTVDGVQASVGSIDERLGSFSFDYGNVAAYEAAGELPAHKLFVVADTPENLQAMMETNTSEPASGLAYTLIVGRA